MSNTYFDASAVAIANGTRADAPDVNNMGSATEAGFGLLPEPDAIKQGRVSWFTDSGALNAYAVTTGLSIGSYTEGLTIKFKATTTNTTSATLNVDGVGAVAITYLDGTSLSANAILTDSAVSVTYCDSVWQYRIEDASSSATAAAASAVSAAASETAAAASETAAATSETNAAASAASLVINWTSPVQIGTDLNIASVTNPTVAALNATDIAFKDDGNNDLRTYRFEGSTFAQVGNDLNVGGNNPSLSRLSDTTVALAYDGFLSKYSFDGTDWSLVGSALGIAGATSPSVATLTSSTVAFVDNFNDELRTYSFDGSNWTLVGSGLSLGSVKNPNITALNATDIAFLDETNDDIRTYRFSGTAWAQVGNDLNITTANDVSLTTLNPTDIAYTSDNGELRTYRFDGTDWAQVGSYIDLGSTPDPSISAMNGTDVVFIDETNDDLRVYRFGYQIGTGPFELTI